jgi:hypothetical protein
MLVIAISLAIATFKLTFAGLIFAVAVGALVVQASIRLLQGPASDGAVVIAVPAGHSTPDTAALTALLRRHLAKARLESVSQTDTETILSFSFRNISEGALVALPSDVREAAAHATFSIFFNRPNAL